MGLHGARRHALAALLATLLAHCQQDRTELMVRVTTDMPQGPGAALESVRLRVTSQGEASARFDRTVALGLSGSLLLPADLVGVTPRADDPARVITVDLDALGPGGAALFSVRARSAFVAHETRVLAMHLAGRCRGAPACQPGETCAAAGCVAIDRAPASLTPYEPVVSPDASVGLDAPLDASDVAPDVGLDVSTLPDTRDASAEPVDLAPDVTPDVTSDVPDAPDAPDAEPLVCPDGRADCDGDPRTGCESDLSSPIDCGACGARCATGTYCGGASLGCVSVCPMMLTRCGFSCADTAVSTAHCGGCDQPCVAENATPSCAAGVCGVGRCNDGYGDCNGAASDGCELRLNATTDCGACGNACPKAPSHGAYTCPSGACALACDDGFVRAGAVCVADGAPRLVAPLSGTFTTSTRVAVRVEPASTALGTQLDFCSDPACATSVRAMTLPPASTSTTVTLPTGVVYWRARMVGSSLASPVWRVNVRGPSALSATAVAWGSSLDLTLQGNGVAAAFGGGTTATPTITTPSVTQVAFAIPGVSGADLPVAPLRDRFGALVLRAGDTNGDGLGELAVTAPGAGSRGAVYVYRTASAGAATRPLLAPQTLTPPTGATAFGLSAAAAGDLNGDGYADLAVIGQDGTHGGPMVFTYHGSAAGLVLASTRTLTLPTPRSAFGRPVVEGLGDVNGDGFADLAVSDPALYGGSGTVRIYPGSALGVSPAPLASLSVTVDSAFRFGEAVACAGDVNGDGRIDLAVGAPGTSSGLGRVYVFVGTAAGFEAVPSITRDSPFSAGAFGSALSALGDVNSDGYTDLAVGAPNASSGEGRVLVYHGTSGGLTSAPSTTLAPVTGTLGYGASLSNIGDRNAPLTTASSFDDLAVGSVTGGVIDVYEGSASGLLSARMPIALTLARARPTLRHEGPTAAGDFNRDGFSDLAVAAPVEGCVYVYNGSTFGLSARPALSLCASLSSIASLDAGDLNGDGTADLALGDLNASTGVGRVLVFVGTPTGLTQTPLVIAAPDATALGFGASLAARFDLSGDALTDLAVGAPGAAGGDGRVYVYNGRTGSVSVTGPSSTLTAGADPLLRFGQSLSAGDVTGDRVADLVVGAPRTGDAMMRLPKVFVFRGATTGLDATPAATLSGVAGSNFGAMVVATGDTDGDGIGDLLVASRPTAPRAAALYRGGAVGLAATPVQFTTNASTGTGSMIAAADLNNDGFSDVILGNAAGSDNRVHVYLGAMGAITTTAVVISAPSGAAGFGQWIGAAGDFNNDRFPDAVIVSNTNGAPRAWVLPGRANPVSNAVLIPLFDYGSAMLPTLAMRAIRPRWSVL